MATIQAYWTIVDGKGEESTMTIDLAPATTPTNAQAFAQAMNTVIGDLINGGIIAYGVRINVPVTGDFANPFADIQEKALFTFRSAGGFIKQVTIPTILEDLFITGTKLIDLTDVDVVQFVDGMVDGLDVSSFGGTGVIQPTTSHGEDLVEIESAREAWGKYRP